MPAAPTWLLLFAAGVAVSLGASWLLVSRLERLGERAGFCEAWLGLAATTLGRRYAVAGMVTGGLAVLVSIPDQILATITQYAVLAGSASLARPRLPAISPCLLTGRRRTVS